MPSLARIPLLRHLKSQLSLKIKASKINRSKINLQLIKFKMSLSKGKVMLIQINLNISFQMTRLAPKMKNGAKA